MLGKQRKPICRVTPDRAVRMKPLAFAADAASLWRLYGFEVWWEGVG